MSRRPRADEQEDEVASHHRVEPSRPRPDVRTPAAQKVLVLTVLSSRLADPAGGHDAPPSSSDRVRA